MCVEHTNKKFWEKEKSELVVHLAVWNIYAFPVYPSHSFHWKMLGNVKTTCLPINYLIMMFLHWCQWWPWLQWLVECLQRWLINPVWVWQCLPEIVHCLGLVLNLKQEVFEQLCDVIKVVLYINIFCDVIKSSLELS